MVEEVESVTRAQAAGSSSAAAGYAVSATPADNYLQAITDAVSLSAQARQVLSQMVEGQTVAEAWLRHLTTAPDLNQQVAASGGSGATGGQDDQANQAAMRQSLNRAMADLSWLFDAMSPPKVDTNAVAKVLAERMAADAVGTSPPLPQVIANAEQTGTTPALYVENLSITTGRGGTTATVDRVALTTVSPSLGQSAANTDRPLVVDVGGEAKKISSDTLSSIPGSPDDGRRRALLVVRQGGNALPEGTLHVKLDVLLPLG